MTRSLDIVAAGEIFLETVFGRAPHAPAPGEEVFAAGAGFSLGGCITVAVAAAEHGANSAVLTESPDDFGGALIRGFCRGHRITVLGPTRADGGSSLTAVLNVDEDRSFISYVPPRSTETLRERRASWVRTIREEQPAWVCLPASQDAPDLLEAARDVGARAALDIGLESARDEPSRVFDLLQSADLFVPNTQELLTLMRRTDLTDALAALREVYSQTAIVKLGPGGALVSRPGRAAETIETRGSPVTAIDPTGAGDSFLGALLAGIVRGRPLTDAVADANAAGMAAVMRLGGVGPIDVLRTIAIALPAEELRSSCDP